MLWVWKFFDGNCTSIVREYLLDSVSVCRAANAVMFNGEDVLYFVADATPCAVNSALRRTYGVQIFNLKHYW